MTTIEMATGSEIRQTLDQWRGAICESLRRDGPDLSARQMAIMLTIYLTAPPHTVRGLAAELSISKPAVTRALDSAGPRPEVAEPETALPATVAVASPR